MSAVLVFACAAPARAQEQSCTLGRVVNVDTQGHCCWPGQAWSLARGACVGVPRCPSELVVDGQEESCVAPACPPGQSITVDTAGHCCWPGQVWAASRGACLGVPTSCPPGTQPDDSGCAAPAATSAPPADPEPVAVRAAPNAPVHPAVGGTHATDDPLAALGTRGEPLRLGRRSGTTSRYDEDILGLQFMASVGVGWWSDESSTLFANIYAGGRPGGGSFSDFPVFDAYNPGLSAQLLVEYRFYWLVSIGLLGQLHMATATYWAYEANVISTDGLAGSIAPIARIHLGGNLGDGLISGRTTFDMIFGVGAGYGRMTTTFIGDLDANGVYATWFRDVEALVVPIEATFIVWIGGVFGIGPWGGFTVWVPQSDLVCDQAGTSCMPASMRARTPGSYPDPTPSSETEMWINLGLRLAARL